MGELSYNIEVKQWKWHIPEYYNIGADIIDKHADSPYRNKIALYWEDSQGNTAKYTFNDLKFLTNRFGNVLKKLGFKKGDRFLMRFKYPRISNLIYWGGKNWCCSYPLKYNVS